MSRYGVELYGAAYYGSTSLVEYDAAPFLALSRNYGQLDLSWNTPGGDWDRLRVVRNAYGAPVNADDGTVILDVLESPPVVSMTDSGLTEGSFYYYTIFVRKAVGLGYQWLRSADVRGLVVRDFGYTQTLLERLPSVFTTSPASMATRPDEGDPVPLMQRFLSLFGFQLDHVRTQYESLREVKNPDKVGSQLLPLLAKELGQVYEPEIGERQMRVLLRNSVYLHKKKGTSAAVTGLASSLAGWGADILPLTNLVLDEDTASAEGGVGSWYVRSGPGTLSRRASDPLDNDNVIPPGAVVGYRNAAYTNTSLGMFQLSETGTGGVVLATVPVAAGVEALRHGIPVDPANGAVTASVFLRHIATSRVPTITLEWYDRRGTLIAGSNGTSSAGATAADWTRRQTVTVTPPATARYLGLVLTYPVTANTEVQLFDAVQVEYAGAATGYRAARSARVKLSPTRINLISNPSFEVDTSGWSHMTGAGGSLVRSTAQKTDGSASLLLTKGSGYGYANVFPVLQPSTTYTISLDLMPSVSNINIVLREPAPGAAFQPLALTGLTPGVFQRVSRTYTTAAYASAVTSDISIGWEAADAAAGATAYIDAVLIEEGTELLPYFDGGQPTFDVGWTGTANASTSVLYTQRAVRDSRLRANIERYLPHHAHYELVYDDGWTG